MDFKYFFNEYASTLKQSGIRAATMRCEALEGINLGQGVCDTPTPETIKQAATVAINNNYNIYADHAGVLAFREAVAQKLLRDNKLQVDPKEEILISHGSTGAYVAAVRALLNPGDEVILFEPFYAYHKQILNLYGIAVRTVNINPDFSIDFAELEHAITPKTKAIIVCTPNNPSGKVYTREELTKIGRLAQKHNFYVITDEIYEYITYPGHEHISLASLEDFKDITITISGLSKTYNITGWRLGYACGPKEVIKRMALIHDLLYICPPAPLQHAGITALNMDQTYYQDLKKSYLTKRELMVAALQKMGFKLTVPQGAYYLMADFSALGFDHDQEAANMLLEQAKVATVTGRSFYVEPEQGKYKIRFCYALSNEKLQQALTQMAAFLQTR